MDNRKLIGRFTLSMPDGMLFSVPVYDGESYREVIKFYIDSWYKNTMCNPEKFDHFVIKDRCPKCGGVMHAKLLKGGCAIWCINYPNCDYQAFEENKSIKRMCEKHGLKYKQTHKTGCGVVFSQNPIKK